MNVYIASAIQLATTILGSLCVAAFLGLFGLNDRLSRLETSMQTVEQDLRRLETDIRRVDDEVRSLAKSVAALGASVARLEGRTDPVPRSAARP